MTIDNDLADRTDLDTPVETVDGLAQPDEFADPAVAISSKLPGNRIRTRKSFKTAVRGRRVLSRLLKEMNRGLTVIARSRWGTALLNRVRNHPRTAGLLAGMTILAVVLVFWRQPPEAAETVASADAAEWTLEDVRILPPTGNSQEGEAPRSPNTLTGTDVSASPLIPPPHGQQRPHGMQSFPETPRAVWLTGVIEEIPTGPDVQRIGHVEQAVQSRNRTATSVPQFPAYRRR